MKNRDGYTIIELIIVITVIAIILATAAPALSGYRTRQIQAERANQEYVLNKAVRQYYALTGAYPEEANYFPTGKYWDGNSSVTSFLQDVMNKTGITGNTNLYNITIVFPSPPPDPPGPPEVYVAIIP